MDNRECVESLVVGCGEVGKSLFEIIKSKRDCEAIDKGDTLDCTCLYMNICIPYSEEFVGVVNEYITQYEPMLTIIHSSVPVGTTKLIKGVVVHSPVRGKHPDIKDGLLNYVKFVGANNVDDGENALRYLKHFFNVKVIENSDVTELMKIASLAKYCVYLSLADEIESWFSKIGSSYEYIKEWDRTQNEHIGKYYPSMQMPIIEPPKGECGGHCVLPVTKFLVDDSRFKVALPFIAYSKFSDL